ncbi:PTS lactose/cellobiose transporter subunit IIA [Clostridium intestinale]|uniref:PTS lactose/cellobiose transporter subunit IIA n=2 Tax=Clostridium intestinale TaxID=36845 RepID=A0A7D6W1D1_9CLOT|nr:PTS lactose/cellobiose transporter subunit IIA [Clostridium intestinale]QLY80651.1 PTS lactose/cellobiose transporter subunit IIA [Clostridium intestinale]SHI84184.1 PTS system, cellobiose-specific IIA component [Clostridium intestinale DSM 6191]
MDQELIALNLISNSGLARSLSFQALQKAREGNIEEARDLLKQASESSLLAHNAQTELIQKESDGESPEYSVLMVHAQDHLMTSLLAKDLIQEMILMYEKFDK